MPQQKFASIGLLWNERGHMVLNWWIINYLFSYIFRPFVLYLSSKRSTASKEILKLYRYNGSAPTYHCIFMHFIYNNNIATL